MANVRIFLSQSKQSNQLFDGAKARLCILSITRRLATRIASSCICKYNVRHPHKPPFSNSIGTVLVCSVLQISPAGFCFSILQFSPTCDNDSLLLLTHMSQRHCSQSGLVISLEFTVVYREGFNPQSLLLRAALHQLGAALECCSSGHLAPGQR